LRSRKIVAAIVLGLASLVAAGAATYVWTRPPVVEEDGLRIDVPTGCSASGSRATDSDGTTEISFLGASRYSSDFCFAISHAPAMSTGATQLRWFDTSDPNTNVDADVQTPCGTAMRQQGPWFTTYVLEHAGTTWRLLLPSRGDPMSSCRFVTP
jgi:hypothetical protein